MVTTVHCAPLARRTFGGSCMGSQEISCRASLTPDAQTGTRVEKIRLQKWYNIYKDHTTLEDYEIQDGMGIELYYNCRA